LYRSSSSAPQFAADLAKETGRKVKAYQCDVTNQEKVHEVFDEVVKDFGMFHGVVAVSRREEMGDFRRGC
jgi:sorbose reductase